MKKSIILLAILVMNSVTFAQKAERMLKKAIDNNLTGNYSSSIKYCEKAIEINPTLAGSYFIKAKNLVALGNDKAAFEACDMGIKVITENTNSDPTQNINFVEKLVDQKIIPSTKEISHVPNTPNYSKKSEKNVVDEVLVNKVSSIEYYSKTTLANAGSGNAYAVILD